MKYARRALRSPSQILVKPISPWGYIVELASADPRSFDGGTTAASLVARHYNLTHLESQKTMWWHLSGAALTIWLTRNWTADQVIAAAAKIAAEDTAKNAEALHAH